jgi:hypothetical protein
LFFKHFDLVFKGIFKKAKLYGLIQHTPFFYQIYPVLQGTFVLKLKFAFVPCFSIGLIEHKNEYGFGQPNSDKVLISEANS